MGFDLVTFIAQIVNLILLVWILKRFLYRPVVAIIEKRQNEIEEAVNTADEKLAQASQLKNQLAKQQEMFQLEQQKRLDTLEKEMAELKAQKQKELQQYMQQKRIQIETDFEQSWTKAKASIQQMIAQQFVALSQKVLAEWTEETSIDVVLKLFQKRINALSKKQKENINKTITNQKVIDINSFSKLSKKQQDFTLDLLKRNWKISPKTKIRFHVLSDLILGIEVRFGDMVLDCR